MASSSTENQIELPQLIQRSDYPSGPCYPSLIINELPLPLTRITGPTHDVLVPGSLNGTWIDDDKCSFNLALYLFGKNFTDICRFVNTKEMIEILSYYYGDFYRSDEYIRWSEFRKGKKNEKEEEGEEEKEQMNKKKKMKKTKTKMMSENMYVESKKIFSGIRHRELISRLVSGASGEIPNLEVFKTFPKGTSIVDYVLFLKDVVGIKNLAGAIAIGQGEIDLTRTVFKRPRSTNRVTTSCQKKTTNETSKTIKLLQGRRRLSEAESEDLFWDTVWPRLLEKGWSLELPDNEGHNDSFIFLVPGVDKFSRTDHVRSVHYFDSVEHVLQRVAEVPNLIEPNDEPGDGGIGCSTGPTFDIGPSCQNSARDISPHADPSNGSPRNDPVSNAHPVEPSRDNLRSARLFDLNNLPQESESEQDNEPAVTDENDTNPLRHSTRISTRTPKGKSYGESMAKNRKRKR
ncbi:hypothetical protein CASFOL_012791 [Castilleja foliolosa]|uniref:SANT domain-containing protein n=1 Tax=Castilleja foliolosa TaxID=1961234 RepID=A0ABD3DI40_9LAMI